jgi:large subunit ribosomal protein L5
MAKDPNTEASKAKGESKPKEEASKPRAEAKAKKEASKPAAEEQSKARDAAAKEEAPKAAKAPKPKKSDARLRLLYRDRVIPALTKEFGYKNVMAVPKIEKVSVNIGLGEATQNAKIMDAAVNELGQIAGQRPVITKAKKSIAAFKLREGMSIGTMVTLRGERMYEFLDRLMNVALPRVRDFRGVSTKSFDGRGNYTLGIKDQLIFPEIDYNKVDKVKGMNISITTTAKTDAEGLALLRHMGMPFRQ